MRIAGGRTEALFLRELRGTPFLDLWRSDDQARVAAILSFVADGSEPYVLGARSGPVGFPPIDCETILLPLNHRGDGHARVLGLCAPLRFPEWLGLVGVEPLAMTNFRGLGGRGNDELSEFAAAASKAQRRINLYLPESEGRADFR